jgi:TonB family protein
VVSWPCGLLLARVAVTEYLCNRLIRKHFTKKLQSLALKVGKVAWAVHYALLQGLYSKEEIVSGRILRKLMLCGLLAAVAGLAALNPVSAFAQDEARKVKSRVTPTYPELARRMNVAGTVKVEVTIAANGAVTKTRVIGGHPMLVDAAVDAVKQWKYEPGSGETTQVVEFKFNPQG